VDVVDIAVAPAVELAAAIHRREISSLELLDAYAARIATHNQPLNAVVTLDLERARTRAREADEAIARGESWGPLHGLPITVKDTLETAGIRTTAGFPPLADHVPSVDAVVVERTVQAGAIVFGKTNVPVLAANFRSYNPIFGVTNNPWNLARVPGGSSGGSAVSTAAGFTSFEIGSDIGGSIRTPCHWCGVYGHKPTHGIIPQRGHIPGPPGTLADFFTRYDVLLTPVNPVTAIAHDHSEPMPARSITIGGGPRPYMDLLAWISPATTALLPATAAPVGRASDGLPVGVQIVGPYLEDRTTIAFAKKLADVTGRFQAPSLGT
jgi:Asp-tRNA(Asn)/Glu-tRNA(Gln) amidotransferase A subunit family amidase